MILDNKLNNVKNCLNSFSKSIWLGAISFEERCIGSLLCLTNNKLQVDSAIALSYPTHVNPPYEDKERREDNWQVLKNANKVVFLNDIKKQRVKPYSFNELQKIFDEKIVSAGIEFVIFDITCLTKIHTLALAASLSFYKKKLKWAIAYTVPENYNYKALSDTRKTTGWKDIIIAPLAENALMFNESSSRGIILPGHEADRLIVGLAEIETSGGSIIIAETPKRPDFRYTTNKLNHKIFRQLLRMSSRTWEKMIVLMNDLNGLKKSIDNEINKAKKHEAPVILFPYGPKLLVFSAAMLLAKNYPEASWFVYPIPTTYDVNYTEGIQETMWIYNK